MQTGTATTTTTKMEFLTTPAPAEYLILALYRFVPLVPLVADDDAVNDGCGDDGCGDDDGGDDETARPRVYFRLLIIVPS